MDIEYRLLSVNYEHYNIKIMFTNKDNISNIKIKDRNDYSRSIWGEEYTRIKNEMTNWFKGTRLKLFEF